MVTSGQQACNCNAHSSLRRHSKILTNSWQTWVTFISHYRDKKNEIVKKQGGVSSSSTWRGATVAPTTGSGGASPACTPAWVWTRLGRSSQARLRDRPAIMVTRGFRGNAPETQRTQTTFEAYNCSPFFSSWNYEFLEATLPGKS